MKKLLLLSSVLFLTSCYKDITLLSCPSNSVRDGLRCVAKTPPPAPPAPPVLPPADIKAPFLFFSKDFFNDSNMEKEFFMDNASLLFDSDIGQELNLPNILDVYSCAGAALIKEMDGQAGIAFYDGGSFFIDYDGENSFIFGNSLPNGQWNVQGKYILDVENRTQKLWVQYSNQIEENVYEVINSDYQEYNSNTGVLLSKFVKMERLEGGILRSNTIDEVGFKIHGKLDLRKIGGLMEYNLYYGLGFYSEGVFYSSHNEELGAYYFDADHDISEGSLAPFGNYLLPENSYVPEERFSNPELFYWSYDQEADAGRVIFTRESPPLEDPVIATAIERCFKELPPEEQTQD